MKNIMKQKKQIIFDMVLNIIAVTVPVAVLQLVIYPVTARNIGSEEYGLMLTIYSVLIMVSNSLGNVLNNVRLLRDNEYEKNEEKGDFNILFLRWNIMGALIIGGAIVFYCDGFNARHLLFGLVISLFIVTKAYLEVGFRLILNYKAIVINNLLQSVGFLIGAYITVVTGIWEAIFVLGYLFSCIFCAFRTKLLKEPYKRTFMFKNTRKDVNKLTVATIISNMMTYADKLVLYPLMGGTAVSIYYTATILGKIVGMLTSPINNVILSYISKWEHNNHTLIKKILLFGLVLCLIGYCVTMLISRPVIGFLFPQWVDEVMHYIPITTVNVLLLVLAAILSPFVLKFCDMKWQIAINGTGFVIYFACALILWKIFGLIGFCFGVMAGNFSKLIIMISVYYVSGKSS